MKSAQNQPESFDPPMADGPLKCVWMLAGIIAYKLCDRHYDCDHCAFDAALREGELLPARRAGDWAEVANVDRQPTLIIKSRAMNSGESPGHQLAEMFFYHPAHIWARVEDAGRVRMGLDHFGQKLVGRIYAVDLPEPGTAVTEGSPCWSIAHRAGETVLAAPLTGTVQYTNEKLALNPSLLNSDPYNQGWAMIIQPDHLVENLERLYYGEQAGHWYDQEIQRLHQALRVCIEDVQPKVGPTLQDGGSIIETLAQVIGPGQLQELIQRFLSAPCACHGT